MQDIALDLVESHGAEMGPFLKPVKILLDGIPSLEGNYLAITCHSQVG